MNISMQIKCKVCDKPFLIKSEYQRHMRQHHESTVEACKNMLATGECKYGDYCWFIHEERKNILENTHNEIQKVFKLMEEMTQRISNLEKN